MGCSKEGRGCSKEGRGCQTEGRNGRERVGWLLVVKYKYMTHVSMDRIELPLSCNKNSVGKQKLLNFGNMLSECQLNLHQDR